MCLFHFQKDDIFDMWRVWEHVDRLNSRHAISGIEILQVACLGGRITADIDDALGGCTEDGLHHIGVHASTWGVGDDHVGIAAPALCDGVGGVLECEGTLELTCTDLELRILAPFSVEVDELYGGLSGTRGIGALDLGAPVEVADLTVEDETGQTEIKGV